MEGFSVLWKNTLLTSFIIRSSRENKVQFSTHGLDALEKNSPGLAYVPMVATARLAHTAFLAANQGTDLNLQKGSTDRIKALRKVINATSETLQAKVKVDFEDKPAVLIEFFPNGRTEVSTANRGDVIKILERWVKLTTTYQAEMGAAWLTRLTNLKQDWVALVGDQSGKKSEVKGSRSELDITWEALSWCFFDIAIEMLHQNRRNPAIIKPYFDYSVFEYGQDSDTDGLGRLVFIFLSATDLSMRVNKVQMLVESVEGTFRKRYSADSQGDFRSANLPIGLYRCTFSKEGFADQTMDCEVFDDNDPVREVRMQVL